jgi:hypothetical protein
MKRSHEAMYYPNVIRQKLTFDDLPDDCVKMLFDLLVGSTIIDHLKYGFKLKSGVNALANLIGASRRAWLLEQTHRYRNVAMIHDHAPDQWFLSRKGRIKTVSYNSFNIHDSMVRRDLKTFSACGAVVDITTNCSGFMQKYTNFIKVDVTLSHLCWDTQFASEFADMLKRNLDCQLTISTTPSCKHYRACEILRKTNQLEALNGFSSNRLNVRGLRIMTRTASVRRWAFINFPEAEIYHASSRWSYDESTVTDDEGSEAEEDSETDEDSEHNHDDETYDYIE